MMSPQSCTVLTTPTRPIYCRKIKNLITHALTTDEQLTVGAIYMYMYNYFIHIYVLVSFTQDYKHCHLSTKFTCKYGKVSSIIGNGDSSHIMYKQECTAWAYQHRMLNIYVQTITSLLDMQMITILVHIHVLNVPYLFE